VSAILTVSTLAWRCVFRGGTRSLGDRVLDPNLGAPTRWWRRSISFSAFRMRRMCLWPNTRVTLSIIDPVLSAPPICIAEVGLGSGCVFGPHSCGLPWISADANRLQRAISTVPIHSSVSHRGASLGKASNVPGAPAISTDLALVATCTGEHDHHQVASLHAGSRYAIRRRRSRRAAARHAPCACLMATPRSLS
jgi:hypothetical protein